MKKNIVLEFIKNQLLVSSIVNIEFFLLLLLFLSGCSGECETAEEIMSDPQTISIYANPKDRNKELSGIIKPENTWISSGHIVDSNQAHDPYFNIINNNGDLCGKDIPGVAASNNVELTNYGSYKYTGIKVKDGDKIKIQLNKKEFTVNCSSPDPDIGITDVDKCKNRYYRKDTSSTDPIEPMEGKKVMLESFISIKNISDIMSNNEINKHIYNTFIPKAMLNGIAENVIPTKVGTINFESNNTIIPGKAFIVPSEYEIETIGDSSSSNKYYSYSSLPDVNSNDQRFLGYQFTSKHDAENPIRANIINKNYWCRAFPDIYNNFNSNGYIPKGVIGIPPAISGTLNRSVDIDGLMLNKFCDKYYYLDKIEESNVSGALEEDVWKNMTLANKPKGNTSDPEKIYSIMDNLSYKMIEGTDLSDPMLTNTKQQPISLNHSRFFYTLNLAITSTNNSNTIPNGPGNINTSYSDCNAKSYLARCDSYGDVQLPLDQEIPINQDGFVHIKIGNNPNSNIIGNANLKITRSCPIKKLYGIFVENSDDLKSIKPGDAASFEIPLYQDDVDGIPERLEKFTIPRSVVSGTKKWLYFSFKDNDDGYDNNTGLIQLATRVPRDYKKTVTKFIDSVINRLMEVLYGKKVHLNDIDSPRIGGVVNSIYNNLINSSKFQNIIRLCAVLLIVIYGLFILMGLAQFNSGDLLRTIIKFGVIFILLQPGSWEFFKHNFFNLFIEGPKQLIKIVTTPPNQTLADHTNDYIFGPISEVIERFTDFAIWKQLVSILLAGPIGWILFLLLLQSCWFFITGSLMAILSYIVSTVVLGLFISIAPIFILMLMFKRTAGIFNAWVKVLMVYTLNAVFVFASLTLISGIVSILINQIFGFGVCTSCIFEYHGEGALANLNFCILYGDMPDNFGSHLSYEERKTLEQATSSYASSGMQFAGFPFPFFAFVSFIIMSHLVSNLSAFFGLMTEDLLGVDFGNPTQAANIPAKVADTMKSFVGMDAGGKQQEVEQRRKKSGTREIKLVDKDNQEKKKK